MRIEQKLPVAVVLGVILAVPGLAQAQVDQRGRTDCGVLHRSASLLLIADGRSERFVDAARRLT